MIHAAIINISYGLGIDLSIFRGTPSIKTIILLQKVGDLRSQ